MQLIDIISLGYGIKAWDLTFEIRRDVDLQGIIAISAHNYE